MGQLIGLNGIANDRKLEAKFISKGKDIVEILANGYGATTADTNGAINIYRDDDGNIRCEALRYMRTIDEQIYTDIKKAIRWTNKWIKLIQ